MSSGADFSCCGLCGTEARTRLVAFDALTIARCDECRTAAVACRPAVARGHELEYSARYAQECTLAKPKACWDLALQLTSNLHEVHRLLDLGCGDGRFLDLARARGVETAGVEIADAQAALARSRGHAVECASAECLSRSLDGTQDLVTCWDLLEHVTSPREVLVGAHRALAEGGRLIVLTPMMGSIYDRLGILSSRATAGRCVALLRMCWSREHLFRFDIAGLTSVLEDIGFHSVRARSILQLSLAADSYAGGEILQSWTGVPALNRTLSRAGVAIARRLRLHNKVLVDAVRGA